MQVSLSDPCVKCRSQRACRSSPDCTFRARCNYNEKTRLATVTTLQQEHSCRNCEAAYTVHSVTRAEISKLKFLLDAVPQLLTVNHTTSTRDIIDAIRAKYGQDISIRQAQKVKSALIEISQGTTDPGSLGLETRPDQVEDDTVISMDLDDTAHYSARPSPQGVVNNQGLTNASSRHLTAQVLPAATPIPANSHSASVAASPTQTISPYIASTPQQSDSNLEGDEPNPRQQKTPKEIRAEAASLFEQASEKFQEAALLHAEATRLFASVANT